MSLVKGKSKDKVKGKINAEIESGLTLHEPKQSTALLRTIFNSAQADTKELENFAKRIDDLKNRSIRATTFLNHLLKDNQFMYKLSYQDVSATLGDIEYIKLKVIMIVDDVNQSLANNPIEKLDELGSKLTVTSTEVTEKYLESVKNLTNLINEKYQSVHDKSRAIPDYNFIELIAELDKKINELDRSKISCRNVLTLRVGDSFGYTLKLNIKGSFPVALFSGKTKSLDEPSTHNFHYPVSYLMVAMDEMLPDINFIKSYLAKTKGTKFSEIYSVNIMNDPDEEIEKILPCTNVIKLELRSSLKFVESMELFLKKSVVSYLKEVYEETNGTGTGIEGKLKNINMVLKKQVERTVPSNSALIMDFPTVSENNYIAIHKTILDRIVAVKAQLEVLHEISIRQSISIHPFNLDVLKQVLLAKRLVR